LQTFGQDGAPAQRPPFPIHWELGSMTIIHVKALEEAQVLKGKTEEGQFSSDSSPRSSIPKPLNPT
jgi:hypothetical protein